MKSLAKVHGLEVLDTGGDGDVVLFSHGLLWSHRMFAAQILALKHKFRCVAYDHRGQGDSEPVDGGIVEIETNYEDCVALIEAMNLAPVHFVGLSMGGFVGMRLAARRPDLVRSLTLLETSAAPESAGALRRYAPLNVVARLGLLRLISGRVMRIFFGPSFLNDPDRAELRATWKAELLRNRRSIYKAVNGVLYREGVEHELFRITAPTLVIWGEEEQVFSRDHAEALVSGIAGAQLETVPGAGHTSTVEQPDRVNALLLDFLPG